MFDFMSTLLGWLQTLANFIINLVESLILAVFAITQSVSLPLALIGHVPMIIGASISIVVAVCVAKFIIGR